MFKFRLEQILLADIMIKDFLTTLEASKLSYPTVMGSEYNSMLINRHISPRRVKPRAKYAINPCNGFLQRQMFTYY